MARPQKTGLDYFPFDVGLLRDKKLRRPKLKYGYLATAVYIALLSLLYSDKGYYIPYSTQNEKDDCLWYVYDCLQGKYQPEVNTIAKVIEELVAYGLFSDDRFPEYITSKRAQVVYYSATVERKTIVIDDTVWLLSLDEMRILSEKHVYYLSKVSRPKNEVNRSNNEVNRPINPQSKENESKFTTTVVGDLTQADYEDVCFRIGRESADYYVDRVKAFLQRYPDATFSVKTTILKWHREDVAGQGKSKNAGTNSSVAEMSADEINKVFAELNKDL